MVERDFHHIAVERETHSFGRDENVFLAVGKRDKPGAPAAYRNDSFVCSTTLLIIAHHIALSLHSLRPLSSAGYGVLKIS